MLNLTLSIQFANFKAETIFKKHIFEEKLTWKLCSLTLYMF